MAQLAGVSVWARLSSVFRWCSGRSSPRLSAFACRAEEEMEGLDIGEHGNVAYPDFVMVGTRGSSVIDPSGKMGDATEGYRARELSKGTV